MEDALEDYKYKVTPQPIWQIPLFRFESVYISDSQFALLVPVMLIPVTGNIQPPSFMVDFKQIS